jgi:precorrin-6A synthase
MKRLLLIGIGAGDPEHLTVQAIQAMNEVDVFFLIDKGEDKADLNRLRTEICDRYITDRSYRVVEAKDPERDRHPASYRTTVEAWHDQRARTYEEMIEDHVGDGECGAFLVWGDPSIYDSTLRIVQQILERGACRFDYEVIPGISAIQALAARHRVPLNRIGEPILITTGRRVSETPPADIDNVVVMLDGENAFTRLTPDDLDIYWGAYLGTADEILVAGPLGEVSAVIERTRREARARKGWIMDTYLLRRRTEP